VPSKARLDYLSMTECISIIARIIQQIVKHKINKANFKCLKLVYIIEKAK